jgi:hypothetical protein
MALHASKSYLKKIIIKSKLIQSIIYKRHQVGWHFKYSQKLTSMENLQKSDSFWVLDKKNLSCDILKFFSLRIHFSHQNIFFWKFN